MISGFVFYWKEIKPIQMKKLCYKESESIENDIQKEIDSLLKNFNDNKIGRSLMESSKIEDQIEILLLEQKTEIDRVYKNCLMEKGLY